jgi:hypothetical protein
MSVSEAQILMNTYKVTHTDSIIQQRYINFRRQI